jgi:NAD(P)-dependent dehydrogenase (short-subunit alcohol dehydrogenase family)
MNSTSKARRTVVVTGAAGGVGAATSLRLAADGFNVICADINGAGAREVVSRIIAEGGNASAAEVDVADPESCLRALEAVVEIGDPLVGVVNNAAVGVFGKTVETTTLAEWDRVLAVNLSSVYFMSRLLVPLLREAGGGSIVNVSSIHAYATAVGSAPYAAAKGGVLALTRSMALDLAADRIRVTCLIPGPIDTQMLHSHARIEGKTLAEMGFSSDDRVIGHVAQPTDVSGVISFLISSDSSYITGSSIQVEGGLLAKF